MSAKSAIATITHYGNLHLTSWSLTPKRSGEASCGLMVSRTEALIPGLWSTLEKELKWQNKEVPKIVSVRIEEEDSPNYDEESMVMEERDGGDAWMKRGIWVKNQWRRRGRWR